MKKNLFVIWILVGIVVAGSIIFALLRFQRNEEPDTALIVREEAEVETDLLEPIDSADFIEVSTEGTESGKTPTARVLPTPRVELESTDPASVNLASGNIQLIELFAFW